ncbi:MAG: glycosyltransferase family 9 protein [Armatimonadetes bacterium]|nr:glycosyltransferase family 9 protein [Armatimonadota bacterium]
MRRYAGEDLGDAPRIAVVTNDALGNFIVATPLMQMLRARHSPSALDYYGGVRVQEFAEASTLIDRFVPMYGTDPRAFAAGLGEPYDLVVNVEVTKYAMCAAAMLAGNEGYVCGPSLDAEGRKDLPFPDDEQGALWRDEKWIAEDLVTRYAFLDTPFIGEIFCRLAYLEGPLPGYQVPTESPTIDVPDVILSCSASLEDKLWPNKRWTGLHKALKERGLSVGVVGAKPSDQGKFWLGADAEDALVAQGAEDMRGRLTLPQVAGALAMAKSVVSLDNGILHLACSTDTPTVGLYRNGIHRLWAPPSPALQVIEPGEGAEVASIPVQIITAAIQA